jgi:ubiquinone/menaquinone biosynthesis C-methylase UbiE
MMQQEEYWNKVANETQFTTPFQFDLFFKYVTRDATILDYGCGYGRTLLELKERQFTDLYGVDFSEEMIKRAKYKDSDIHFDVVNSGKLPYPDRFFDSVLLFAVLTCVHEDQEQDAILQEMTRVLKPGGVIYMNDFLLNEDQRNLARYEQYYKKYHTYGVFELADGAVLRHHDEERVKEWTDHFERLVYEKVEYTTMNGNRSNGLVYMGRLKD